MERVITVRTKSGGQGKLYLARCTTWETRKPKKRYTVYLHRSKNNRWFKELKYYKTDYRDYSYEIGAKEAAHWLISEEYGLHPDLAKYDRRENIERVSPDYTMQNITDYCLNCMRAERDRPECSVLELEIIEAVGEKTMLGRELADCTGRPFNSHFRTTLARLVAKRLLEKSSRTNGFGDKGYRRPVGMS